jgi:tripartite-type tricarboxylate transporter receptor subunit TctC
VFVENIAGAGGNLAAKRAADAAPDGYTLLLMSTSLAINPWVYKSVAYDPVESFQPVGLIGTSPHVLAASPESRLASLADVLAAARKSPGKLTYATGGNGTTAHLGMELLKRAANVDILHVPYKSAGSAIMDVQAGRVDLAMFPLPSLEQFVSQGKLVGLAITDVGRTKVLPAIPSAPEAGAPGLVVLGWWGVVAPARVPPDISAILQRALSRALSSTKLKEALAAQGMDVRPAAADAFGEFIRTEVGKWREIVRQSGTKIDE